MQITQINLQTHFGGGEVYTAFLCRALDQLGVATTLYAHPAAQFWERLTLPASTCLVRIAHIDALPTALPQHAVWLLGHGALPPVVLNKRHPDWLCTAIAHMPLQGRNPRSFDGHDMVFPVSGWVREGLIAAGAPTWHEPLYGVADLDRLQAVSATAAIHRESRYDWDKRKVRDRALGVLTTLLQPFWTRPAFIKRPGLTLGIVSRLTPIKQFPLLFSYLVPVLVRYPNINLEIFGSGGYASVRDLAHALRPLAGRVRFWGQQSDVRSVYAQLDYLLSGLPEKEALGLNIIEAQACDLPVLAVKAPPFTETVIDGVTGFLYRDPREDQGVDFAHALDHLLSLKQPLRPAQVSAADEANEHLARFSLDAFTERLRPVVAWVAEKLSR